MGYVYFIRGAKTGLIKVGFSTNPESRLANIQTGCGESVSLIMKTHGTKAEERAFHARFEDCHERGEWFREEGSLLSYLQGKKRDLQNCISANLDLSGNVLTRGFCKTQAELDKLYKAGLSDKEIYVDGRSAENLEECIEDFRGRPGLMVLASDTRAFGNSRPEILTTMKRLEAAGIRVTDVTHPEDRTNIEMLERGAKAASKMRFVGNHRMARRRGSMGGMAKAVAEAARRNALIADPIAQRLCASSLTWAEKSAILGMTISTIQRHYK